MKIVDSSGFEISREQRKELIRLVVLVSMPVITAVLVVGFFIKEFIWG